MKPVRLSALAAAIVIGLVALGPCATVLVVPADESAPPEVAVKLTAAKRAIVDGLDRVWWTRARYVGLETRASDHLVVLRFELYGWPNFVPVRAYLASRCRPLADIDPRMMGGGIVDGDFATNLELEYLRSPAQGPCRAVNPQIGGPTAGVRSVSHERARAKV
jgi:hypothetical protein